MTVLDLRPAPGAAPPARRVLAHARTEALQLVRNGEQLLLALVIPIGILLLGRFVGGPLGGLDTLAPSVLALAVWSSAFTSLSIATGFERRYGVLERLAATPLGRAGLLSGKALATGAVLGGQIVILATVAVLLGWRPAPTAATVGLALAAAVLAASAYAGLALALAGRLRAEVTLAVANLVYVVLLAGGALVLPLEVYPAAVRPLIMGLPTAALGEGLRAYAVGDPILWPPLVLAAWAAVAAIVARRVFRWTA